MHYDLLEMDSLFQLDLMPEEPKEYLEYRSRATNGRSQLIAAPLVVYKLKHIL